MTSSLPADDPAVNAINKYIESNPVDKSNARWRLSLSKPPVAEFDASKTYSWHLKTNHGDMTVKLMPAEAPMHVSSTMYLSMIGFYDDLIFHRVIPGFMAQGGCPLGTGTGGPGYQYTGEFGDQRHDRPGLLSMANAGPGTDGSQFFLTFVPTPWLDGNHTIFGEVVAGNNVLGELEKRGSEPQGKPLEKLQLISSHITVA